MSLFDQLPKGPTSGLVHEWPKLNPPDGGALIPSSIRQQFMAQGSFGDLGFGTILECSDGRHRYMLVADRGAMLAMLPLSGPGGIGREVEYGRARDYRIIERIMPNATISMGHDD